MAILSELSQLVSRQRVDMGLSQQRLAELAGLSRATVNQLETGRIGNLSLTKDEKLANVLGFGLGVTGVRRDKGAAANPLETAARIASVSYAEPIPVATLRASIVQGVVPPGHIPHMRALLEEAPIGVLSAVARQLASEEGLSTPSIWLQLRQLARALGTTRAVWQ